jgi:hypothetical protein
MHAMMRILLAQLKAGLIALVLLTVLSLVAALLFAPPPFASKLELSVMLLILPTVALLWRMFRPTPRPLLRWYVSVAGGLAFLVMLPPCLGVRVSEHFVGFRIVIDASVQISGCLLLELVLSTKPGNVLATAVARIRRERTRSSEP